jgi:hypothetical protein
VIVPGVAGVMAISAAVLGLFTFLIVDEDEEDELR